MTVEVSETALDDVARLESGDPSQMLRAVASAPAQVREAAVLAREAGLQRLAEEGRPRSLVVVGMGGSGIAGDVLAAVAGSGCPVPVLTYRGYGLPGWVGAADLVVAVSCSGSTEETLSGVDEAVRRGCRLLCVGGAGSPLAERATQARAPLVTVPGGRQPRASMWALSIPLVVAADTLGLVQAPATVLEAAALRLEQVAMSCRPSSEAFVNPAKALAVQLAGTLPMVWGTSALAGVAAYRFACQLAENAKYPAVSGVLPEANHNQVVCLDGPYGATASPDPRELFRDRVEDSVPAAVRLRLVLLRDDPAAEHPQVARRAAVSQGLADERGVGVSSLLAEGGSSLERLASLVGVTDYASVYLGLGLGIDPTPVAAIEDLKVRIRA